MYGLSASALFAAGESRRFGITLLTLIGVGCDLIMGSLLLFVFGGLQSGVGVLLLVTVAILMACLVGWVKLHQRAGIGPVQAVVVGVVGLVVILGAIVLEAVAWMGAL